MKNVLFAMAMMLFAHSTIAQNTNVILSNYLTVKNALVNSDSKAASKAISALEQSIKAESNFTEKASLLKATEAMSKATNIDKQRAAFNEVSTLMWKTIKGSEKLNQPLYYQYCPMKKAYWVSEASEIKNPYYGNAMLTCGKVVESKE